MKKITLILMTLVLSILFFVSCGKNKDNNTTAKKTNPVQISQEKQEMTVEKACKLDNDKATLLMQNYWDKFKGKEYNDVKDIYEQYLKGIDSIYNKYGVSTNHHGFDVQSYQYWVRDHRSDMKKFRKANPEYDFYVKYPEFLDANSQILKFAIAKHSKSKATK